MPVVRIYSKAGDEKSVEVRELLRENKIAFTDYDIEKYPSMKEDMLALTKNEDTTPVIMVDSKVFFGKNVVKELRKEFNIKGRLHKMISPFVEIKQKMESHFPQISKKGARWDYLEPKSIGVGVTSGLPSIDRATLVEEAMNSIGKGCDLMRLDVESHNHLTPKDKDDLKALAEYQGMKWAIHADLTMDLTRSEKTDWEHAHTSLKAYIKMAKEIKAVYVNIHASVYPTPAIQAGIARSYEVQLAPDGNLIWSILDKTEEAKEWYVRELTRGVEASDIQRHFVSEIDFHARIGQEEKAKEIAKRLEAIRDNPDKLRKAYHEDMIKDHFAKDKDGQPKRFDNRISEWTAYMIVAWSMYKKGDPLWKAFCGDKNPEQLIKSLKAEDTIKVIDAVAGAYVRGHFEKYLDDLKKDNVIFVLENPDARGGQYKGEKQHRLMTPTAIYHVVKDIDSPQVRLSIDWEHIAMQGFDPWKEAEDFPGDIGRFVLNFDVNSHPNVNHLQHPVERGDKFLYNLLWEVKKRGLGKAYLMYEWGGGRKPEERWLESVPALKMIAKMLENEVPPDELPAEFFGIGPAEIELEKRIMERNAFKPFEGTLEFPELSWGFFSGELKKKGRLEQWVKEEYR